jgi:hypothetical protein
MVLAIEPDLADDKFERCLIRLIRGQLTLRRGEPRCVNSGNQLARRGAPSSIHPARRARLRPACLSGCRGIQQRAFGALACPASSSVEGDWMRSI